MEILLSAFCLYLLWVSYKIYRTFLANRGQPALPPGPPPLPVIGNLLSLSRLPHRSLHNLSLTYGPILKLSLGRVTTVVVSSPSLAREILQTHDSCFSNRFVPDALTALDHHHLGLGFLPISPLFKTLRKICNTHVFSARKLDGNRHLHREQVRQLIEEVAACVPDGRAVNIGEASFQTTLNLLANTVFSVNMAAFNSNLIAELKELVKNLLTDAGKPNVADYFPVLKRWDPQGMRRKMEANYGRLFVILDEMVGKRTEARMESGEQRQGDLLETLLEICQGSEAEVNIVVIKHLILDFFVAGTDTTTNTLEWAMTELLLNPEKLSKVQYELRNVIDHGQLVEESDLNRLPYLQAVIKETFRLHPAAPLLIPRIAGEDKPVGGYLIPKGAQVLVNVWAMGRDPCIWGKTAGEFIPERFLGSEIDLKGHHFELLPFGSGRRICPGLPLAVRMLHMMLGSLLSNFDWKLEDRIAIDTDEHFGLSVQKAQPLKAVPMLLPKNPIII
ncbi:hypothetical protein MLD38_021414 [Melastoma candidum]|uniref:Uncharacterized protein n=1 Tax=Melastoma candidum TaxID=119954 RepID=A0ACB9QG98_9MYRT|nr:hypothetical protein MLD38_021414 [Melastoma candidum]